MENTVCFFFIFIDPVCLLGLNLTLQMSATLFLLCGAKSVFVMSNMNLFKALESFGAPFPVPVE